MGMPKITVIMPSLNVANYIDECMESVLNQTMQDIEILCIDAGSTDGTLEKLNEYAKQNSQIRIINSDVKSYGYQVNLGIDEAKGDYIAIVETDDYIDLNMFEKLYNLALENQLDYAKGNFESYCTYNGHRRFSKNCVFPNGAIEYNCVINPSEYRDLVVKDSSIWRGIYSKVFLDKNNIRCNETQGAAYQDIGFVLQVYCKAKRCMYIEDSLYFYQLNRDGASSCKPEVLLFVESEFRHLFENNLLDRSKSVFIRMVYAFGPEIERLLVKLNFVMDEQYVVQPYTWLKGQILSALSQNIICENDFDEVMWKRLRLLLESLEKYVITFKDEYKAELEQNVKRLAPLNGRSVIIFGCGPYGRRNLLELERLGADILCVCDNDISKIGGELEGYPIISPNEAHTRFPEAVFVIPDRPYKDEMIRQVEEMGAEEVVMNDEV